MEVHIVTNNNPNNALFRLNSTGHNMLMLSYLQQVRPPVLPCLCRILSKTFFPTQLQTHQNHHACDICPSPLLLLSPLSISFQHLSHNRDHSTRPNPHPQSTSSSISPGNLDNPDSPPVAWKSRNTQSLGSLIKGFFGYYASFGIQHLLPKLNDLYLSIYIPL